MIWCAAYLLDYHIIRYYNENDGSIFQWIIYATFKMNDKVFGTFPLHLHRFIHSQTQSLAPSETVLFIISLLIQLGTMARIENCMWFVSSFILALGSFFFFSLWDTPSVVRRVVRKWRLLLFIISNGGSYTKTNGPLNGFNSNKNNDNRKYDFRLLNVQTTWSNSKRVVFILFFYVDIKFDQRNIKRL